ncbi:MAG TPA: glycosyltransferase family 39 protein [Baekduia sp.]|nr:glycosyltransferase family 39 protein [Baekduia sp.]
MTRRLQALSALELAGLVAGIAVIAAGIYWRIDLSINHLDFENRDQHAYSTLAYSIAFKHSYDIPNALDVLHWAPGAPFAMAAGLRVFGVGDGGLRGAYVVQCLLSIATIGVLFAVTRRFAGGWRALAAAAVLAISTGAVIAQADLITEPLGALLLLLAFGALGLALLNSADARLPWWFAAAGGLLGAAVLTRPDFLFLPIAYAVLVVVLWKEPLGSRLRGAGTLLVVCIIVMAPYCTWASLQEGKLVTPTTSGPSTYWVGTYLPGDGRTQLARKAMAPEIRRHYPDQANVQFPSAVLMMNTVAKRYPGLSKDEAISKALRQNIEDYAFGQPLDFAWMEIKKPYRMWAAPYKGHSRKHTWWGDVLHLPTMVAAIVTVLGALWFRRRAILLALAGSTLVVVTAVDIIGPAIPRANARTAPIAILGAALAVQAWVARRDAGSGDSA